MNNKTSQEKRGIHDSLPLFIHWLSLLLSVCGGIRPTHNSQVASPQFKLSIGQTEISHPYFQNLKLENVIVPPQLHHLPMGQTTVAKEGCTKYEQGCCERTREAISCCVNWYSSQRKRRHVFQSVAKCPICQYFTNIIGL